MKVICNGLVEFFGTRLLATWPIMKPVEAQRVQIRMEEAHTLRMLAHEFRAIAPSWDIYPRVCYHRDVKGVIHETEYGEEGQVNVNDQILLLPRKIQEDEGRFKRILGTREPNG
jgi:hypothetical protein